MIGAHIFFTKNNAVKWTGKGKCIYLILSLPFDSSLSFDDIIISKLTFIRHGVQLRDIFFHWNTDIHALWAKQKQTLQGQNYLLKLSLAFGAFETGGQVKKGKIERSPKAMQWSSSDTWEWLNEYWIYFDIFWSSHQIYYIQWLMKIISWIAHLWHEMIFVLYCNKIILLIIIINICHAWRICQENMSRDMIYFCLILWFWERIAW